MHRSHHSRRALTAMEVLLLLALALLVLIVALMVLGPGTRGPCGRTTCAANLSGMGKAFYTYANENADDWPIAVHKPDSTEDTPEDGDVTYVRMIGALRGSVSDPAVGATKITDTKISTARNLWLLIRFGASTPASFICPSSDDTKNNEDNPQDYWDFGKGDNTVRGIGKQDPAANWLQVSYGYQVPYGKYGRPNSNRDARMVLAADKGPFGAALDAGKQHPGIPALGMSATPDDWRRWNSPNHGGYGDGEGQNLLITDSHVDFTNKPTAGVKDDNIYTRWSDATGGTDADPGPRINGTPPKGTETPFSETDSLIYP